MSLTVFQNELSPSVTDTISVDGTAFNLTGLSVTFSMRPAGSSTLTINGAAATIVSASAGTVRYDWVTGDTATAGNYVFWWTVNLGGGKTQDTPETDLQIVAHSPVATSALCTVTDVHLAMETPETDTSLDPIIAEYINEASDLIQKVCHRQFAPVQTATTYRFGVNNRGRVAFSPYCLQSADTVVLHPETTSPLTIASTDYQYEPWPTTEGVYMAIRISPWIPLVSLRQLKFGRAWCDVTGTWGFPSVPTPVKRACVVTVRTWLRKDAQAMAGSAASSYYSGQELPPQLPTTYALPAAVLRMLQRYTRNLGVV